MNLTTHPIASRLGVRVDWHGQVAPRPLGTDEAVLQLCARTNRRKHRLEHMSNGAGTAVYKPEHPAAVQDAIDSEPSQRRPGPRSDRVAARFHTGESRRSLITSKAAVPDRRAGNSRSQPYGAGPQAHINRRRRPEASLAKMNLTTHSIAIQLGVQGTIIYKHCFKKI